MTNFYFDFEFHENGVTIDPISVGIVTDTGREYYAVCSQFNFIGAWTNEWLKENVLYPLYMELNDNTKEPFYLSNLIQVVQAKGKARKEIAYDILRFVVEEEYPNLDKDTTYETLLKLSLENKPNFWGYFCDYDWVVLCQLFGKMIDLPPQFPMYSHDIKQVCDSLGNPILPEQGQGEHNALEDARWNRKIHYFLQELLANAI